MMSKFFTAIGVSILPALAGLVYPVFYRNDGKVYVLFAAFTAGAVLAAGVQNLSYSAMYTWADDTGESANMYTVVQHAMWQFAVFFFLRFCFGLFYKDVLEKLTPPHVDADLSESEGLLEESRENIVTPSVFDGSSDLIGSTMVLFSLSCLPFLVGFSIGVSPFDHNVTLAAYTLHRIAGAVALSRSLDLRGTPSAHSWMSLASYTLSFPLGIILGSFCEREYVNGFVIMQCSMTAAILIYDSVVENLPKIVKSGRMVFVSNGDYYVFATFAGALLLFLVLESSPPQFRHDIAKHPNVGGFMNHMHQDPNGNPINPQNPNGGGPYQPPSNNGNQPGQNYPPANNGGVNYPNNNGAPANNNGNNGNYYPPADGNNNGNNYPPPNNGNNGNYYPPVNNNNGNNGGYYPPANGNNAAPGGNNNGGYYPPPNQGPPMNNNNDFGYQPNNGGRQNLRH